MYNYFDCFIFKYIETCKIEKFNRLTVNIIFLKPVEDT